NWPNARGFTLDPRGLVGGIFRRLATAGNPKLRMHAVPFEEIERHAGFVVQRTGKPPCRQLDAMPLQRVELGIESRDVLLPVIVGEPLDADLFEHRRALLRPALAGV